MQRCSNNPVVHSLFSMHMWMSEGGVPSCGSEWTSMERLNGALTCRESLALGLSGLSPLVTAVYPLLPTALLLVLLAD